MALRIRYVALVLLAASGMAVAGCSTSSTRSTPSTTYDPSGTVPGFDYGDSLTSDYEYCKGVGNRYAEQGSGSAEEGYNACLDAMDRVQYGG